MNRPGKDYIGVGCGALIVNDENETILLKRSENCHNEAGYWTKPGGTVEFGETVEDAIIREIKEEIGVEIELTKFINFTNHILKSENQHWVSASYLAQIKKGTPRNMEPHKHTEFNWFAFNALPDNLTQTTRESIDYYLNNLV